MLIGRVSFTHILRSHYDMQTVQKPGQLAQRNGRQQAQEPHRSLLASAKPMVRSLLDTCSQTYRGITSAIRVLPDFLIIGCQRGGTSSLYYYLTEQYGILSASTKEVHFFDDFYTKGLDWYRAQFPATAYKAYIERVRKRPFITGEASPYYIFHPHAPRRAAQVLPEAKIIALLRNPD